MVEIVTPNLPVYRDRRLSDFTAPGQSVLWAEAEQAWHDNPTSELARGATLDESEKGQRISRWGGRREPDSPLLDQKTGVERVKAAGLEGQLEIPASGIRERSLNLLIENKKDVNRRNAIISRSPGGVGLGAAGLATQLGVSILDPVNIASAFVPVVGEARYAGMLARTGSALGRTGIRAAVGAAEGVVGQALLEPLNYATKTRYQEEYGLNDALANIAFGGLFGAVVHNIAPAVRGGYRLARGRDTTVARAALSEAVSAHLEGRQPRVSEVLEAAQKISARQESLRGGTSLTPVSRAGVSETVLAANGGTKSPHIDTEAAARPQVMNPASKEFKALSPVNQAIESDWALANDLNVVDDIERLSAQGMTASQIIKDLGVHLRQVDELAAANGEAHFARNNKVNLVRAVRSKLDIPAADDRVEFAKWRDAYTSRSAPEAESLAQKPGKSGNMPEINNSSSARFDAAFTDSNPLETVLRQIRDDRVSLPADESAALTEVQRLAKEFDSGTGVEAQLSEIENYASATEELIALEREAGRITPEMEAALKDAAQRVSDAEKRGAGLRQAAFCIGRAI